MLGVIPVAALQEGQQVAATLNCAPHFEQNDIQAALVDWNQSTRWTSCPHLGQVNLLVKVAFLTQFQHRCQLCLEQ
jgi:hypothetical protein